MTDAPKTFSEMQEELRTSQTFQHPRSPHYVQPDPMKRSRVWYWVAGAIVAVGVIAFVRGAKGAENTSPVACNTDLGGVAKTLPDGSRLSCIRIDQRKE